MIPLGDEAQLEGRSSLSDRVLNLTPVRGTVCVERIVGLKILLDAPMELLGDAGYVESRFFPFRDSVGVGAR